MGFGEADPADRRALLEGLVRDGHEPGLLAYQDGASVGWCAVGPRQRYQRMMSTRSEIYRPVDEDPDNWVINCFYLPKAQRQRGIATELLDAAIDYAFAHGATSIDGYPRSDASHGEPAHSS